MWGIRYGDSVCTSEEEIADLVYDTLDPVYVRDGETFEECCDCATEVIVDEVNNTTTGDIIISIIGEIWRL